MIRRMAFIAPAVGLVALLLSWGRPHPSATTPSVSPAPTDPARTPIPMLPPQLQHQRLDLRRHLMRTRHRPMRPIRQALEPIGLIPPQPGVKGLPRDTHPRRYILDRPTLRQDSQNRLIPLLRHTDLPHTRECQESTDTTVKHQPKQRKASTEHQTSSINRSKTLQVEPPWGVEPQTYALRVRCSTN